MHPRGGSSVARNRAYCSGFNCDTDEIFDTSSANGNGNGLEDLTLHYVDFTENRLECRGESCDTDEIWDSTTMQGSVTLSHVDFDRNVLRCDGFGCDTDEIFETPGPSDTSDMTFRHVRFRDNQLVCRGAGCDTDELIDETASALPFQNVFFEDVLFANNLQCCAGDYVTDPGFEGTRYCDTDEVIDRLRAANAFELVDVTLRGNRQACWGASCDTDELIEVETEDNATFI